MRSDSAVATHLKKILNDGFNAESNEADTTPSKARKASVSSQDDGGGGGGVAETDSKSSRMRWSGEEEAALIKYASLLTKIGRGGLHVPDWEAIVAKMESHDNFPERSAVAARAHYAKL
jgi:hypothetical protein